MRLRPDHSIGRTQSTGRVPGPPQQQHRVTTQQRQTPLVSIHTIPGLKLGLGRDWTVGLQQISVLLCVPCTPLSYCSNACSLHYTALLFISRVDGQPREGRPASLSHLSHVHCSQHTRERSSFCCHETPSHPTCCSSALSRHHCTPPGPKSRCLQCSTPLLPAHLSTTACFFCSPHFCSVYILSSSQPASA